MPAILEFFETRSWHRNATRGVIIKGTRGGCRS